MRIIIEDTDRIFADVLRLMVEPDVDDMRYTSVPPRPVTKAPVAPDPDPAPVVAFTPEQSAIPPAPGPDLDTEGLPHDPRIHSASREKNKDGTWRIRRNTGKELVEKVKGELKSIMGAGTPAPTPAVTVEVPPAPTVTTVAEAPPPPPPVVSSAFPAMLTGITNRVSAGEFTLQTVMKKAAEYSASLGIDNGGTLLFLNARPDLIPGFEAALKGAA